MVTSDFLSENSYIAVTGGYNQGEIYPKMAVVSMEKQLLSAGVHFGHQTRKMETLKVGRYSYFTEGDNGIYITTCKNSKEIGRSL